MEEKNMKFRVAHVKEARRRRGESEPRIIKIKAIQKDMDIYFGKDKAGVDTTTAKISNTSNTAQHIVSRRIGISQNLMQVYDTGDIFAAAFDGYNNKSEADLTFENALAWDALEMPNEICGKVKLNSSDTFSREVGEQEAVNKAVNNWEKSINKAITRWQAAMLVKIIQANPDTFDKALEIAKSKYE